MKNGQLTRRQAVCALTSGAVSLTHCPRPPAEPVRREFRYVPGPPDNPMKGFLPFAGDWGDAFPHSMEWAYFPLNAVMTGPAQFDFENQVEPAVAAIANRGHQAALRFYLDYPAKPTGVPEFLIEGGLRMRPYDDHGGGFSPDYEDENLTAALADFITALGDRYDNDGRVAYLTLGLLGFWGEWHTYPRTELMASEKTQRRVLAVFAESFLRTPLLMRYPMPDAMSLPVGLHDDSFAHSTIGDEDWQFVPRIRSVGAEELWKTRVIGGEVRPEVQSFMWKDPAQHPPGVIYQDFAECVRQTHATWMINQHLFNERLPRSEYRRAIEGARMMGYDLFVSAAEYPEKLEKRRRFRVSVEIENRGSAPIYPDWPLNLELVALDGRVVATQPFSNFLSEILPGMPVRWEQSIDLGGASAPAKWIVQLRTPQPFEGAPSLRFANAEMGDNGTMILGQSTGSSR